MCAYVYMRIVPYTLARRITHQSVGSGPNL